MKLLMKLTSMACVQASFSGAWNSFTDSMNQRAKLISKTAEETGELAKGAGTAIVQDAKKKVVDYE